MMQPAARSCESEGTHTEPCSPLDEKLDAALQEAFPAYDLGRSEQGAG